MSNLILVVSGINRNNESDVQEAFAAAGMSRHFVVNNDCEMQSHKYEFSDPDFQMLIANIANLQANLESSGNHNNNIIIGFKKEG